MKSTKHQKHITAIMMCLTTDVMKALNDWNKTVNAFFDEHTPHYK